MKANSVDWELGPLRNELGQLELEVPADGLPLQSAAPGRDKGVTAVITEARRSSCGRIEELHAYSAAGDCLAAAGGPMLCVVCRQPAVACRRS